MPIPRDPISNGFFLLRSTTEYYALGSSGIGLAQAVEPSSAWGGAGVGVGFGVYHRLKES